MATEQQIVNFNDLFKTWEALDFSKVYREGLGTASFQSIKPIIKKFDSQIKRIPPFVSEIGDNTLKKINNIIARIIQQLNSCINYSEIEFLSRKPEIDGQINALYQNFLDEC